jgi:uroporphyrinogen-III decarboxylase
MLSVPYEFTPPDRAELEPFRRRRAERGSDCIGGAGVNSMVAMLCGMMSFEQLLEWVVTERGAIKDLADAWLERTGQKVEFLLSQGVGPFWHFNGVERASPPMMGPRQWEELVVPYDGEIIRRIKAADPESLIHVHCHGRVGTPLDSFVEMGVDSIDPVEPPPQGDVDMAEAKRTYDGRLVFFGNIAFADMETRTPEEIEEQVRRAIEDGGRENVVLCPSATPHERHSRRFTANAVRYPVGRDLWSSGRRGP